MQRKNPYYNARAIIWAANASSLDAVYYCGCTGAPHAGNMSECPRRLTRRNNPRQAGE